MKRLKFAVAALSVWSALTILSLASPARADAKADIPALDDRFVAAVKAKDLDATMKVYVPAADLAYSHSIQHVAGADKKGKKLDLTVRVTDVYKKISGNWLVIHEHVSVPVDLDTGKPDLASKP